MPAASIALAACLEGSVSGRKGQFDAMLNVNNRAAQCNSRLGSSLKICWVPIAVVELGNPYASGAATGVLDNSDPRFYQGHHRKTQRHTSSPKFCKKFFNRNWRLDVKGLIKYLSKLGCVINYPLFTYKAVATFHYESVTY